MTSETRKEDHLGFRITLKEHIQLEEARALVGETTSQFCKLSLSARIKWVFKTKKEK